MRLSPFPHTYHCTTKLVSPNHRAPFQSSISAAGKGHKWSQMCITSHPDKTQKVVVIVGPTGSGKSRLSIDLAARFFAAEVVNSDKIQLYRGLDITTNKIPMRDRLGVPHHLLGEFDPDRPELSRSEFRALGASAISDIASRRKTPIVVGGSNSFVYALVSERFYPDSDVFSESGTESICREVRYDCCFLWVDVGLEVLRMYLKKRVDDMADSGMVEELAEFFDSDESGAEVTRRGGLRKAIGVPEFERYFKTGRSEVAYEEAVRAIKENTCRLAERQVGKIRRLREGGGWELRRLDATEAVRAAMGGCGSDSAGKWSDIWERQVVEPSVKIVKRFLEE